MPKQISLIKASARKWMRIPGGILRSKYIEIIFAVTLFIILDAGVLIINFYTSYQIANDAHAIQLASRMGTLSQRLLHELYQVHEDARAPDADYIGRIDTFAASYKLFDETLDAFLYGGELIGQGQGQDALLRDAAYRNTSAHLLEDAEDIWKVYRVKLQPIVYAYFNDAGRGDVVEAAAAALAYSRLHSDKLLDLLQSFGDAIEGVAQRKAERLRTIQSIGISLAVINFFLILFHFLKRLSRSDALVEKSRKETEDILETVNEGLFLLNRNYIIGSQHSKSLRILFNDDNLAGQNFIDMLRPLVTEKTLETVEEYTEILFSPRVNESLVSDLNPLNQVEIHLVSQAPSFTIRYFSFQFSRVYEHEEFNALLVTVKDVTELVELSKQLKAANEKVSREIDMLLAIIHVENSMLASFLRTAEDELHHVNNILKAQDKGADSLRNKLETIGRIVHKLKGDSTTLGLEFVMEKFQRFEGAIKALREQQDVTGQDFLPLVVHLDHLMSDFAILRNLEQKVHVSNQASIKTASVVPKNGNAVAFLPGSAPDRQWQQQLATMVERVAADYGKQALLDMSNFDEAALSEEHRAPCTDIIVQSLRNAVAHGIEPPDIRERAGKCREGKIKIALAKNGAGLQLTIRDDGQGIDLEKIRAVARARGLVTERQLEEWSPAKLLSLLFRHGFTTSAECGLHAGQGIGLDLIKSHLDSLNGRVKVRFQKGRYTEFQYDFANACGNASG